MARYTRTLVPGHGFNVPRLAASLLLVPYVTPRGFIAQCEAGREPTVLRQVPDGLYTCTPNAGHRDNWYATVRKVDGRVRVLSMVA